MNKTIFRKVGDIAPALALAVLLAVPFLLSPEKRTDDTEKPEDKIIVLSPHWEGVRYEFEKGFIDYSRAKTGRPIGVEWLNVGGTADMVRFISSEFARNSSSIGVDVVFGGGIEAHGLLASRDHLSPVSLPEELMSEIPETLFGMRINDEQSRWFSAALSGFGIIYNRPVLKRLGIAPPETWEDLARPEMFTWVGSGDFRSSGSTHMVYEIILQAYGWEKGFSVIMRMGANVRSFTRSSTEVPRDTALGEIACGMALDSYAWNQMARTGGDRIGYVLPPGLTVINPDAVAVLKGAPNKEGAEMFIRYVLSRRGQALWMMAPKQNLKISKDPQRTGDEDTETMLSGPRRFPLTRMSVRRDIHRILKEVTPVKINPFAWEGSFEYDDEKSSARWDVINALLGAALIENHGRLQATWQKLIAAGLPHDLTTELTRPPVSEEELMEIAGKWNKDPRFRSRLRVEWVRHFRNLYRNITRKISTRPGARTGCGK